MIAPLRPTIADRMRLSDRAQPLRLHAGALPIRGYLWRHPAPTASVILIHGLQSHAGWFAECAEALLARGYTVYAPDRRGAGTAPGTRGDIDHYADWLAEALAVIRLARFEAPGAPVHLIGHCFGANIALGCALLQPQLLRSLLMLTPGLHIRPDYAPLEKLRILASGTLRPQTRYPVPQDDSLFTRDPAVLDWIRGDPLGTRTLTARCLLQSRALIRWLRRDIGQLKIPLLVLDAACDRIADTVRNRIFLTRALGPQCHFATFDAEHFLVAEHCRRQVIDAMDRWITQQEGASCPRSSRGPQVSSVIG